MVLSLLASFALMNSVSLADGLRPAASNELVEVAVEAMLAPAKGYDDNDNIQLMVHGFLPNACYTLAKYTVEKSEPTGRMKIRQFALKQKDGLCAENADLPDYINMAVPFTQEVSLGQLPAGDYNFEFSLGGGKTGLRGLNVATAVTPSVDNMPYAAVSSANISDILPEGDDVEVVLGGVLNSTCTQLADEVKVQKVNDVYVVLPTIKVEHGVFCAQVLTPFQRKLNLGKTKSGHYLIHVRSMNGRSVNKIIEVAKP